MRLESGGRLSDPQILHFRRNKTKSYHLGNHSPNNTYIFIWTHICFQKSICDGQVAAIGFFPLVLFILVLRQSEITPIVFHWPHFACCRQGPEVALLCLRRLAEFEFVSLSLLCRNLLGIVVQPLDLHLVNVGSISIGPTHGEGRLQPRPGDVLKSTPNVRKSPRSGSNLEGRLSDPQVF